VVEQKKQIKKQCFFHKKVFSISVKGNFFKDKTFYKGSVRIKLIFWGLLFHFHPKQLFHNTLEFL